MSGDVNVSTLMIVAVLVLCLNLPCGYVRAGRKRFTLQWFLAVHASIPIIVTLRFLSGLGWHLTTFPVLVAAYFSGQLWGACYGGFFQTMSP